MKNKSFFIFLLTLVFLMLPHSAKASILNLENSEFLPTNQINPLKKSPPSESIKSIPLKKSLFSTRVQPFGLEWIRESIFTKESTLVDQTDLYILENNQDAYAFLQLTAADDDLLALLYFINEDGSLGDSTGFGVFANQNLDAIQLPIGRYALIIGSANGEVRGNYKVHWNSSNPIAQPNEAMKLLNISPNLTHISIYYSDDKILNNGKNVMTNLTYKDRRDFHVDYGYAHITTSIYNVYETGKIYIGHYRYKGIAHYFTDNALIIELKKAGYTYVDSYYQNINGHVTNWMKWEDPVLKLRTPRILGDDILDEYFGPHYLVVDLNTDEVIDFASPFNRVYAHKERENEITNVFSIN